MLLHRFTAPLFLLPLLLATSAVAVSLSVSGQDIRRQCDEFLQQMRPEKVLMLLSAVEDELGNLYVDGELPSLYNVKGVALFSLNQLQAAEESFREAVRLFPHEARAWYNLYTVVKNRGGDVTSLEAKVRELMPEGPYFPTRDSSFTWKDEEYRLYKIFSQLNTSATTIPAHPMYFKNGVEGGKLLRRVLESTLLEEMPDRVEPCLVSRHQQILQDGKLKVGLIFNTLAISPVFILIHGLMRSLKRYDLSLYCFILSTEYPPTYEWQYEHWKACDGRISLANASFAAAAETIQSYSVDILIDVNGLNIQSGLLILSHQPAPVQISFLGDPYTSGAPYITYYLADRVSHAAEFSEDFHTEKLMLLTTPYLISSHKRLYNAVARQPPIPKSDFFQLFEPDVAEIAARDYFANHTVIGAFHGSLKIDADCFTIWMNILRRSPRSVLVLDKPSTNMDNVRVMAQYHGFNLFPRILFLRHFAWDEHLRVKTGIDLYVDTLLKNGHSTTVDAAWAGLPMIGLRGREMTSMRITEAIAENLHISYGLGFSAKEYEDLAVWVTATTEGRSVLQRWRRKAERMRWRSSLFDVDLAAREMVHLFRASIDLHALGLMNGDIASCQYKQNADGRIKRAGHFHIIMLDNDAP